MYVSMSGLLMLVISESYMSGRLERQRVFQTSLALTNEETSMLRLVVIGGIELHGETPEQSQMPFLLWPLLSCLKNL